MRVLQLVQRPQRRGAELFARDLAGALERRGARCRTVYLYGAEHDVSLTPRPDDVVLDGAEGHPAERFPGLHPGLLGRVRNAIRVFRPAIVQANGARTVKYGAAARGLDGDRDGWRLVYRNIGLPSDWHDSRAKLAAYRAAVVPRLDGVVSVSERALADARRVYGLEIPAVVIGNAVDPRRLGEPGDRDTVRARHDVEPEAPVLLYLGSLTPEKRPERFLRLVQAVADQMPEVRAWMVGDGPLRDDCRSWMQSLELENRLRIMGEREYVAPYLAAADLLVVTSDSEGMPASVLEAGWFGVPTVAPRVGGLDEAVLDGETGLLTPPGDDDALFDAVLRLLRDGTRRHEMGRRARGRVRSRFTIERAAERYLVFYREVLGASGLGAPASVAGRPAEAPA